MVSPLQQKIRVTGPIVITANKLVDGAVVHRTASGEWSEVLGDAQILWSAENAQKALKAAQGDGLEAVGPYVARIDASEKLAQPGNIRELIRANGPTLPPSLRRERVLPFWRRGYFVCRLNHTGAQVAMYVYDEFDRTFVAERAAQFRDQVARRLSGELTEDEFKPLRLMNGVYLQLHAYMLRIAIPYGTLSSKQLRKLAYIARAYDRGYGHFTTRQNLQLNWIKLSDMPQVLEELAEAGVHAIQTSGNCVRNTTTDQWGGVAPDEIEDPRFWAEIVRQWSTLHPEFSFLPRKFKIAITGAPHDRAAIKIHDVGLRMIRNAGGETGFEVSVGGGLGRTPFIAKVIRSYLPKQDLLSYLEAILRVYNSHGRRDNIYKARIKILVHDLGAHRLAAEVEKEWSRIKDGYLKLDPAFVGDIRSRFIYPQYEDLDDDPSALRRALATDRNSRYGIRTRFHGIRCLATRL